MEKILRRRGRRLLLYAAEDRALPPSGSPGTLIRGGRLAQAARGASFRRFRRSGYLAERRREVKSVRVRGSKRQALPIGNRGRVSLLPPSAGPCPPPKGGPLRFSAWAPEGQTVQEGEAAEGFGSAKSPESRPSPTNSIGSLTLAPPD